MDKTETTMFIGMLALIIFGTALFDERNLTGNAVSKVVNCEQPNIILPYYGQVFATIDTVTVLVESETEVSIHVINEQGYEQYYNGPKQLTYSSLEKGVYRVDTTNKCGKTNTAFSVVAFTKRFQD